MTFLQREVKRGNAYDFLIFDPPAFGRGGKGNKVFKAHRLLYHPTLGLRGIKKKKRKGNKVGLL